jgi:hypothetical protein
VSRRVLGHSRPPVQWVPGVLCPGVKRGLGRDADHSPDLVRRSWRSRSYTSSPPCASIAMLWDCFTWRSATGDSHLQDRCEKYVCVVWVRMWLAFFSKLLLEVALQCLVTPASPRCYLLAYFPNMDVGLSYHQSVCVSPTNNFWAAWYIFMKFGTEVVPFKGTVNHLKIIEIKMC